MTTRVDACAARILAIDWVGSDAHTRSRVALLREYLRRAALWLERLPEGAWPFFDAGALIEPSVRADSEVVERVESGLHRPEVFATVRESCVWALHFAALRDAAADPGGLPDPYEPLLLMYERGGGFTFDGTGFIQVDFVGVPKGTPRDYRGREPLASLDRADLDRLDG